MLTSLGEAQAAKLAQFWLRNQVRFDEVYCGALARQARTEQVIAECFRESSQPWPPAQADAAWNEYDAPGVLQHSVPAAEFEQARSSPDGNRRFQRMFEAAMLGWLESEVVTNGVEPWAVFTSGGPIGFAVQFALQAPARSFLDVNWRVRNCSVTEFVFDRERFSLDSFNGIAHLDDTALRTYR